jgi:hypothetical protein
VMPAGVRSASNSLLKDFWIAAQPGSAFKAA